MKYNKEEVETHLNVISKYYNYILSLFNKYGREKYTTLYKLMMKDLIYYSDGLLERLAKVFNYISNNFKDNIFLTDYRLLKLEKRVTIAYICRRSALDISRIGHIKEILETVLRVINGSKEKGDKMYLKLMT